MVPPLQISSFCLLCHKVVFVHCRRFRFTCRHPPHACPFFAGRLLSHIMSRCFFGHIRASTMGGVHTGNCHPFVFGHLMFMHNGGIPKFLEQRVHWLKSLSLEAQRMMQGTTDSEYIAAYIWDRLRRLQGGGDHWTPQEMQHAVYQAIRFILKLTIRK